MAEYFNKLSAIDKKQYYHNKGIEAARNGTSMADSVIELHNQLKQKATVVTNEVKADVQLNVNHLRTLITRIESFDVEKQATLIKTFNQATFDKSVASKKGKRAKLQLKLKQTNESRKDAGAEKESIIHEQHNGRAPIKHLIDNGWVFGGSMALIFTPEFYLNFTTMVELSGEGANILPGLIALAISAFSGYSSHQLGKSLWKKDKVLAIGFGLCSAAILGVITTIRELHDMDRIFTAVYYVLYCTSVLLSYQHAKSADYFKMKYREERAERKAKKIDVNAKELDKSIKAEELEFKTVCREVALEQSKELEAMKDKLQCIIADFQGQVKSFKSNASRVIKKQIEAYQNGYHIGLKYKV